MRLDPDTFLRVNCFEGGIRIVQEMGETPFNLVIPVIRAVQFEEPSAEESYRLQKVGGMVKLD